MTDVLNQKNLPPRKTNLLKYYRFDNFIAGENNNFALAFAKAVAESPGKEYNPLFIYSNVGLGKTHLLNAIGNAILDKLPESRIFYISSQQFEAELVEAIQFNKIEEFRERYTDLDVLLLDDVQFIAFKESAQQEFFHAFNELFNNGKQIVLSSDRPPSTLSTLEQRLRSRFEGGIITEMGQPDLETRKAILNKKLEEKGIILSDEVVDILCNNIKEDIRKLEGALKELIAFSKLAQKTIDADLAFKVLRQKMQSSPKNTEYSQPVEQTNSAFPKSDVIVKLESPNDNVMDVPDTKKPLKINLNLPPKPAKKDSLIRMETKNININMAEETNDPQTLKSVFSENNATTQISPAAQKDSEGNVIGIDPSGQKPQPVPPAQTGNIHYESLNLKPTGSTDKNTVAINTGNTNQMPPAQKDDSYQKYIKDIQKNLDENSISVTSVFASQNFINKVEQKTNQPSVPEPSAKKPAEPETPKTEKPVAPAQPQTFPADDSLKPSLTNIFSSKDVKEKINQIIAVGTTAPDKENNILGSNNQHQGSPIRNAFEKEHKKKLNYELKHFDDVLKKINKGKINIYYLDAIDDFTQNLELAHIANKEGRYQIGLDHIRKVKKSFLEMTLDKDETGLNFSKTKSISQNLLIGGAIVAVFLLIGLILYFLLFGNF